MVMTSKDIEKQVEDFIEANKDNSKNDIKAPLTGKIVERIIRYQNLTNEELCQILDNKNDITNDGFFIMTGRRQNSLSLLIIVSVIKQIHISSYH